MYDLCIIGAGICGCFLAHRLAHYPLRILWLDREADVANQTSMANSAIIHSGHDPKPGTLKARFNLRGNAMYEGICRELHTSFRRTSAFVAAVGEEEESILRSLHAQAQERRVPAFLLTGEQARAKEPHLNPHVTLVMELPSTGIITPWETAAALAEEAVLNGVDLRLNTEVTAITAIPGGYRIAAGSPVAEARMVINAAGLHADEVTRMVWPDSPLVIRPRKGEYFVLDHQNPPLLRRVLYPIPTEKGKGVLAIPTIHGNLLLGPDSHFQEDKADFSTTAEHLADVREQIGKTTAGLPMNRIIHTFSGLRAVGNTGDFVVEELETAPGFFQVAAVESPGLTAAPAIAEYVAEELMANAFDHTPKETFLRRRPPLNLAGMMPEERSAFIREHPEAGHMVCRCEQVSEAEILDAIHRPVGARTVKGVKKRVRPGMGRCQGGFCEPLVVEILARELHVPPEEVLWDGPGSELLLQDMAPQDHTHGAEQEGSLCES